MRKESTSAVMRVITTLILITACIAVILIVRTHRRFPPKLESAHTVIVLLREPSNEKSDSSGWLEYSISDSDKVGELVHIFTQNITEDSGDCGFGDLRLVFYGDDETVMLLPALDGCPTVYAVYDVDKTSCFDELSHYDRNRYFCISESGKNRLYQIIRECFPQTVQNWVWDDMD